MTSTKGFDGEAYYSALARTVEARELNWKQVSKQTGVGASTLTRMAQGKYPDAASLAALSAWSGLNPASYVEGVKTADNRLDTVAEFSTLLRADRNLSPEAKNALEGIVRAAYDQLKIIKS